MFPFQFMVAMLCGWLQCEQEDVIAFLREENRVLKAQLEGKGLRLDDSERRRLAELGHRLGPRLLGRRRHNCDPRHHPALAPRTRRA